MQSYMLMVIQGAQPSKIVNKKGLGSLHSDLTKIKVYGKDKNHGYIEMQDYIKAVKCFIKKTLTN